MKQKTKYIVMPLGGGTEDNLQIFIDENLSLNSPYGNLLRFLEDVRTFTQAKGDNMIDKVKIYLETMKDIEGKIKKSQKKGVVEGIKIDGETFEQYADKKKVKKTITEKNKFYSDYVSILHDELKKLVTNYAKEMLQKLDDEKQQDLQKVQKLQAELEKEKNNIKKKKALVVIERVLKRIKQSKSLKDLKEARNELKRIEGPSSPTMNPKIRETPVRTRRNRKKKEEEIDLGIETGNDNSAVAYNEIMEKMKKLNNLIDEHSQLVSDYNSATEDEKDDIQD